MFVRLWLLFLTVWSLGGLLLMLVALSDTVFRRTGLALLANRAGTIVVWPFSLLSAAGRSRLRSLFVKTQGEYK